jgi:two-component system chemotaxis sensor kinase CheA
MMAGINRERVLEVARKKGIVAVDITPTDEQIDQLIFAPGFSTADAVSDISGRGVGMDVVLSNIKKIGGSVHVRSWSGRGTRMTLRLPLTLAVLDVMLVRVSQNPYVVPLSSIVETMQCSRANFERMPTGARCCVRGEYVQVVDLANASSSQLTSMPPTASWCCARPKAAPRWRWWSMTSLASSRWSSRVSKRISNRSKASPAAPSSVTAMLLLSSTCRA